MHWRAGSVRALASVGAVATISAAVVTGTAGLAGARPAAGSATITTTIPSALSIGEPAQTFTATLTTTSDFTPQSNARVDFTIQPSGPYAAKVDADDLNLEYDNAGTYTAIPLTQAAPGDVITGYFGPAGGFPVGASYDQTTTFRVSTDEKVPPGTLTSSITLDTIGDDQKPSATLASTGARTTTLTAPVTLSGTLPTYVDSDTPATFSLTAANSGSKADFPVVEQFTFTPPASSTLTAADLTFGYTTTSGTGTKQAAKPADAPTPLTLSQPGGAGTVITATYPGGGSTDLPAGTSNVTSFTLGDSDRSPVTTVATAVQLVQANTDVPLATLSPVATKVCAPTGSTEYAGVILSLGEAEPTIKDACTAAALLDSGALSRASFVAANIHSSFADVLFAEDAYETVLHRDGDTGGLKTFASRLAQGATLQSIEASMANSGEFAKRAGGTAPKVIDATYETFLDRHVDSGGLATWTSFLQRGGTVGGIAARLESSSEGTRLATEQAYEEFLGRPADPSGLATFSRFLAAGNNLVDLYDRLLVSQEFYNRAVSTGPDALPKALRHH